MNRRTGILFFARTPSLEADKKNWTQSKKQNLLLAKKLYNNNLSIANKANHDLIHFDEHLQSGRNFNERIANALNAFFNLGYENAIVIGSDCVNLSLSDIENASSNLVDQINTIGESHDGGLYLFTISRSQFSFQEIIDLPWCTPQAGSKFIDLLFEKTQNKIVKLDKKHDVDSDLNELISPLKFHSKIVNLIITIVRGNAIKIALYNSVDYTIYLVSHLFRGPPVFRSIIK